MNTRIIMLLSCLFMGAIGLALSFMPGELLRLLGTNPEPVITLLLQLTGGLYLGFAMLNWMSKNNLLGGIYNRPIAIGNFMHFLVGALALVKNVSAFNNPTAGWAFTLLYLAFAIAFGLIVFTHPAAVKSISADKKAV